MWCGVVWSEVVVDVGGGPLTFPHPFLTGLSCDVVVVDGMGLRAGWLRSDFRRWRTPTHTEVAAATLDSLVVVVVVVRGGGGGGGM